MIVARHVTGEQHNLNQKLNKIPKCPRQESNLRTWLRRPMLYPLSYGSVGTSLPLKIAILL